MNTSLDQKLADLQKQELSLKQTAQALESQCTDSSDTALAYCGFLYSAGLFKTLFLFIIKQIKKKKPVPWFYFFLLIKKFNLQFEEKEILEFFDSFSCEADWPHLLAGGFAGNYILLSRRHQKLNDYYDKHENVRLALIKEMKAARRQGFDQKEEDILNKLIEEGDRRHPLFTQRQRELKEKKALKIIKNHKRLNFTAPQSAKPRSSNSQQAKNIFKHFKLMVQTKKHKVEDLAIALAGMNHADLAAELLENYLSSASRKWLYLDFLLESNQHLVCLNAIDRFEEEGCSPEAMPELLYAKARALRGLGERCSSENLLKEVIKIKPRHQSAETLLSQWKSEEKIS